MSLTYTWSADPEMVRIFDSYSIRYYSLLFGSGIYISGIILFYYFKNTAPLKISFERLAVFVVAGIVIGARLGHCLFYDPAYYFTHPIEMVLPIQKIENSWRVTGYLGLASHGGIIGMLLSTYVFSKREGISFAVLIDGIALVAPLAGAFIRIGNFMNSEIIGIPTNNNYGIIFSLIDDVPRHPSQLYEALTYFTICIIIFTIRKRLTSIPLYTFSIVIILIFTSRFLVEFTKINQASFESGMFLNMGQLLSLPFILLGSGLIVRNKLKIETN